MNKYLRTSQGGSVAGFLIVGLALVVLAGGGIYFVQQRDASPASDTKTGTTSVTDKKTADNTKKKQESDKKANNPQTTGNNTTGGGGALPETGPADSFATILLSAILAGFGVAYVQSLLYRFATVRR